MPEVNIGNVYTLADLAKQMDPSGGALINCAQTLSRSNPIVREVPIVEANQLLTHVGNRMLTLPTVGFRAINKGVARSKHTEKSITEPMALMEAESEVDVEACRMGPGTPGQVRKRIDDAHIEAMSQKYATTIFYGNIGDDELSFNGLATRFTSSTTYPNGDSSWYYNVALGGGDGSNTTSIWVIEWGLMKAHLIYPKGTQAGIEIEFMGKQRVLDGDGNPYWAYCTNMKWRAGIYIQDERCIQRYANIESSGPDNIFDDDTLITLLNRLPSMGEDSMTRIYCNRTIRTQMDIKVKDKNNVNYTVGEAFGKPVLFFRGVPVQVCDAITNAETVIS